MKNSGHILIVDDNTSLCYELMSFLTDYHCIEASNGEEALRILKQPNLISLIILDVMIPGDSGTVVLKKIRKMSVELPVIIITGYGTKTIAIEALREKANDFIEKPLDLDSLKSKIQKYMDKSINFSPGPRGLVERAENYIQHNVSNIVSLSEVASELCISSKYLSRIFKEYNNLSFSKYQSKMKMEKAQQLLMKTDLTGEQIAFRMGYGNPESFFRAFNRTYNMSPGQYRKNNRKIS